MELQVIRWDRSTPPDEAELRSRLEADGFRPFHWRDGAGARYEPHTHDCDESLWILEGAITFRVGEQSLALGPGDRLMLPQGTVHSAVAGSDGASYLVGESG